MSRFAFPLACLLCLICSAFAQNITNTPFANLTLIRQNEANFSSDVALPNFPCDSASTGRIGGYRPLDLDDIKADYDELSYVSRSVLTYFLEATANLTNCDSLLEGDFNISDACSQVRPNLVLCQNGPAAFAVATQCTSANGKT